MKNLWLVAVLLLVVAPLIGASQLPDWAVAAEGDTYYLLTPKSAAGWFSNEQAKIELIDGYVVLSEYNSNLNYGSVYKVVKVNPTDYQIEVKVRSVESQWYFGASGNLGRSNLVFNTEQVGVFRFDLPKVADNDSVNIFIGTVHGGGAPQAAQRAKVEYIKLIPKPRLDLSKIMTSLVFFTALLFK